MKQSKNLTNFSANCDNILITSENRQGQAALEKAYKDLYLPTFPLSEGNTDLNYWQAALDDPDTPYDYSIAIVGDNLRSPNPHIRGMSVSVYFKESDIGHLSYIVVNPDHRKEGLGNALFRLHEQSMLLAANRNNKPLQGTTLNCVDPQQPNRHGEDKNYDPNKRLSKYKKWGGKQLPVDIVVPDREKPKTKKQRDYTTLTFPHPVNNRYPDKKTLKTFFADLYRWYGHNAPKKDSAFKRMVREINDNWPLKGPNRNPGGPSFAP